MGTFLAPCSLVSSPGPSSRKPQKSITRLSKVSRRVTFSFTQELRSNTRVCTRRAPRTKGPTRVRRTRGAWSNLRVQHQNASVSHSSSPRRYMANMWNCFIVFWQLPVHQGFNPNFNHKIACTISLFFVEKVHVQSVEHNTAVFITKRLIQLSLHPRTHQHALKAMECKDSYGSPVMFKNLHDVNGQFFLST